MHHMQHSEAFPMAGFLFTGTARNEIHQEFYAEIDIEDGWKITPSWKSMEELLNEQYGPSSRLSAPALGFTQLI